MISKAFTAKFVKDEPLTDAEEARLQTYSELAAKKIKALDMNRGRSAAIERWVAQDKTRSFKLGGLRGGAEIDLTVQARTGPACYLQARAWVLLERAGNDARQGKQVVRRGLQGRRRGLHAPKTTVSAQPANGEQPPSRDDLAGSANLQGHAASARSGVGTAEAPLSREHHKWRGTGHGVRGAWVAVAWVWPRGGAAAAARTLFVWSRGVDAGAVSARRRLLVVVGADSDAC
eukprot:g9563.t1